MRRVLLSLVLLALNISVSAQLKVFSDGHISACSASNQAICNDNVYLQSMTFYGDCHVLATNETSIGSNVTNIFPIGGVVVESGSTHINLANGVTIAGDFEVKQGAELIIE